MVRKMTNKELQEKFLQIANVDENGYSKEVLIEELKNISPDYETRNGCQWARTGVGLLKNYKITRKKQNNKIISIKLDGFQEASNHSILQNVIKSFAGKRCAILDTGINIEIDHKNGKYNQESYDINDFQPLSKSANDAKRQHCLECKKENKRYDARKLGYHVGWIFGDEDTTECKGCYWNDVKLFNQIISQNYTQGDANI